MQQPSTPSTTQDLPPADAATITRRWNHVDGASVRSATTPSASDVEAIDLQKLAMSQDPIWPYVRCAGAGCTVVDRWGKMENVKVWTDDGESYSWTYTCWTCKAGEWGCTPEEARLRVLRTSGYAEFKKVRCDAFNHARANVQQSFLMLGIQQKGN